MTSLLSFSISFFLCPSPLSSFTHFQLHLTLSACPPTPLHLLLSILMQLHYIHCQTSLRLASDLLGSGSHTRGTVYIPLPNLSDPSSLTIMGNCLFSCLTPFSTLPTGHI